MLQNSKKKLNTINDSLVNEHRSINKYDDDKLPTISFILPIFNAEKYIKLCLEGIFMQQYNTSKVEIIIADGESFDSTLSIVNSLLPACPFKLILINNKERNSDDGKFKALKQASGEIMVFIDADNIIASKFWLRNMVLPLIEDEGLLGVESNYLFHSNFSHINIYSNLLVIVDPLARIMASKPKSIDVKEHYYVKTFNRNSFPVAGANGFLWRKSFIDKHNTSTHKFAETNLLTEIAQSTEVKYANIPNEGVYHYYCDGVVEYFKKRTKIAKKFLNRQKTNERVWLQQGLGVKLIFAVLYLASFIGPFCEGIFMAIKTRKIQWLFHPFISFGTVLIYTTYKIMFLFKSAESI